MHDCIVVAYHDSDCLHKTTQNSQATSAYICSVGRALMGKDDEE